ncbi:(2Fe-2S)-binding protein [Polymorphospora rubra]|uniref:Proline dehydrogenase n=1 Tax=Polymorphospora rubra TaxID=338584 RepID=A0A810ND95_9ACTN|nr:(2Fe-2S)-binding protein [Polymorphospora rubra]BCJ70039.1 proline dehydrogenase [Polymorphospora rubra]
MTESSFTFDDRRVGFTAGQTVGAALIGAGIRSWRTTRVEGRPRGVFCGIGVCFDCLITIDGVPNQRACLIAAQPGMAVRTQEGGGRDQLAV